jgi:ribosomal protein L11 methyltransferase
MWRQLAVTVEEKRADSLAEAFDRLGAVSVSFEDAGEQPLFEPKPGETPLWRETRTIALFEGDTDTDAIRQTLEADFVYPLANWISENIQDQAWERAWLEHFHPMRFGHRLWVCPTGFEPPDPTGVNLWLDPGLAFGTGTHPTTALCLEWLDGQCLRDKTVLDYGCGSGILAVAALRLGAREAFGVDIDPQAITASRDNAIKNGVESQLHLFSPREFPAMQADILLANILAGPLVELADELIGHVQPGGRLALSGLLKAQAGTVQAAYETQIDFAPPLVREDWVLLIGVKRST